jgi:signal transduction histidine kinase/CheY-like chemotaxis protein
MNQSASEFLPDVRLPLTAVIFAQVGLGVVLALMVGFNLNDRLLWVLPMLALFFYLGALATWGIDTWQPWLSRWFPILTLAVVIISASLWLERLEVLTLLSVPISLAAALVGPLACILTAGVLTPLVIVIGGGFGSDDVSLVIIILTGIWSTVIILLSIYGQMKGVTNWAWGYYRQAASLLEEARSHRGQLVQALEDLAQANAQLIRLNKLAQGLQQMADEARQAKEEFVANVSHELRTPLNMIIGFTEVISEASKAHKRLPPNLPADLAVIHRNALHLSDLINDVLDLSQVESGQMVLFKENVAVAEIIEAAAEAVRPLYQSKQLYLQVHVENDLPSVFADRTRLREVMLNLLSNAGRFTERGGVTISAWREQNDLLISVADTGVGISEQNLSKLFQPFQQGDGSIRRLYGGTGLGLSISKRFIELHDGRIWVESQVGVGTTFHIRIPLAPPVRLPPRMGIDYVRSLQPGWEYRERTGTPRAPGVSAKPRWVVAETGKVLTRLLGRHMDGVEVIHTDSLEGALREISSQPSQALIVNEISLSNAMQRLEGCVLPPGTLALVCSIPGAEGVTGLAGVAGYLVKPVLQDMLFSALESLDLPVKTILVVDDEPDALRLFRRMLSSLSQNYHVLRAENGSQGLEMLRKHHPDVVLLDLMMPEIDGFQFLEIKSQDESVRDIPVIVLSAQDPEGHGVVSRALGVTLPGGLSAPRLLACCRALTDLLSPV